MSKEKSALDLFSVNNVGKEDAEDVEITNSIPFKRLRCRIINNKIFISNIDPYILDDHAFTLVNGTILTTDTGMTVLVGDKLDYSMIRRGKYYDESFANLFPNVVFERIRFKRNKIFKEWPYVRKVDVIRCKTKNQKYKYVCYEKTKRIPIRIRILENVILAEGITLSELIESSK